MNVKWIQRLNARLKKELDAQYFLGADPTPERVNTEHMLVLFALLAVCMALFHGLSSRLTDTLLWAGFGAIHVVLAVLVKKTGRSRPLLYAAMLTFTFFTFYIVLFAASSVVSVLWLLAVPFILCYFMEFDFTLSFLTLLSAALIFLLSPIFDAWRLRELPISFFNGFPLVFVMASVLAIALRLHRDALYQTLRFQFRALLERQHHDPLTNFFSRGVFEEFFEREIALNRRYQSGLQIMLGDVRNFHVFNEMLGYGEGDRCLTRLSSQLRRQLRVTDYCFRWEGDVFLFLLPQTSPLGGANLADRIRRIVAENPYVCQDGRTVEIKLAIGYVAYDGELTKEENLELLNAALREDKRKCDEEEGRTQ